MLDEQTDGRVGNGHWPECSTTGYGDFGGGTCNYRGTGRRIAARPVRPRFFYCAKADTVERNAGLENLPVAWPDTRSETGMGMYAKQGGVKPKQNSHCCVKPLDLCRYLSTLILPPNGNHRVGCWFPTPGTGAE